MENLLIENEEDEFVTQPSQLDEVNNEQQMTDNLLTSLKPIDPSHDVIQFRDVAIADKDNHFILYILSILSEDGKELVTTSSKCRHNVRGIIY